MVDKLHISTRKSFPRRHVTVHAFDNLWQADVVEILICDSIEITYILTVIDVLSKHAWAEPLKAKSGNAVTKAIAKIIRDNGRCPKNLTE